MRNFPQTILISTALLLTTACSTSASPTFGARGNSAYRIECGGFFGDGDTGGCYQKAGEVCMSQGYRVLQTSTSSMIIECRSTSARESANRLVDEANQMFIEHDWPQVVKLSTEAIEIDPTSAKAYTTRSGAYLHQGKLIEAKADAEDAIKLEPDSGMAHNNLGVVYERTKDTRQAKAQYSIACELGVDLGCSNLHRISK